MDSLGKWPQASETGCTTSSLTRPVMHWSHWGIIKTSDLKTLDFGTQIGIRKDYFLFWPYKSGPPCWGTGQLFSFEIKEEIITSSLFWSKDKKLFCGKALLAYGFESARSSRSVFEQGQCTNSPSRVCPSFGSSLFFNWCSPQAELSTWFSWRGMCNRLQLQ